MLFIGVIIIIIIIMLVSPVSDQIGSSANHVVSTLTTFGDTCYRRNTSCLIIPAKAIFSATL